MMENIALAAIISVAMALIEVIKALVSKFSGGNHTSSIVLTKLLERQAQQTSAILELKKEVEETNDLMKELITHFKTVRT